MMTTTNIFKVCQFIFIGGQKLKVVKMTLN